MAETHFSASLRADARNATLLPQSISVFSIRSRFTRLPVNRILLFRQANNPQPPSSSNSIRGLFLIRPSHSLIIYFQFRVACFCRAAFRERSIPEFAIDTRGQIFLFIETSLSLLLSRSPSSLASLAFAYSHGRLSTRMIPSLAFAELTLRFFLRDSSLPPPLPSSPRRVLCVYFEIAFPRQ